MNNLSKSGIKGRTGVIIQARISSTRLSGKIMLDLVGKTVLQHVIERCKKINADEVIVATSTNKRDDIVENFCKENDYSFYRGSEDDVLARYFHCAKEFSLQNIVRITSDDPFIDYELINEMLKIYFNGDYDYVTNNIIRTLPYGLDCNIFSFSLLKYMFENAKRDDEREHVTTYVLHNKNKFKIFNFKIKTDYSNYRLTIDTLDDYCKAYEIYMSIYPKNNFFLLSDIIKFLKKLEG